MKFEYDTMIVGHTQGMLTPGDIIVLNRKGAEGWQVLSVNKRQLLLMREVK